MLIDFHWFRHGSARSVHVDFEFWWYL